MRTYKIGYAVVPALCALALMVPSAHAAELNNISVGRFQDFTVVTLFGNAQAAVSHQAIEAKGGKPNRIVVDLTGLEHGLPKNNFESLPPGSISRIRTSQFAVSPEPVVRVVLDLATAAAYKLETEGNNVRIMVSLPSDPPMAGVWSAKEIPTLAQSAPPSPAPLEPQELASAVKPGNVEALPMPMVEDQEPSSPPVTPSPVTAAVSEPKTGATTPTTPEMPSKPTTSASATKPADTKLAEVPPAGVDAPEVPLPMPTHRGSQVIDYNFPRPGAVAMTEEPAKAEPLQPESAKSAPAESVPAETTPAPKKAVTGKASAEPAKALPPAPKPVLAETEAPAGADEIAEEAPKAEPKRAITRDQGDQDTGSPALPGAPSEDVKYADTEGGSAPIASLTTLPPMEADLPSVVPARTKIVYHTNGRRDPFLPLLQVGAGYNAAALPDVSTLRLVGLLHDVDDSWGLFEDANGFGYILRKGDRVKNGRLNKLTQSRAYFQLNEFGWSRSVELDLEPEG